MFQKLNAAEVERKKAEKDILEGKLNEVKVTGALVLKSTELEKLPSRIECNLLDLRGCPNLKELPVELKVRHLNISGCRRIEKWPERLEAYEVYAAETPLQEVPETWKIQFRLDLNHCVELEKLPDNLRTGTLNLSGCSSLRRLPEGLEVFFLDLAGCTALENWPQQASVKFGRLDISGCTRLRSLPPWLQEVAQLNVGHCPGIKEIPAGIKIGSWLDLADSAIQELPLSLKHVPLRWRGVPVDHRVAFEPETITALDVLGEKNSEKRRVLLERMGYEKFLTDAKAKVLDKDCDPGGERRLLKVNLENDEPLVCLAVFCPSTGRQYMLRVPPVMTKCHNAAAWIAGFDNPDDYHPIMET